MTRKLKDIETTEVSFVDAPAIKRKFLFFKQDKKKMKIEIESDGTIGGTDILIDGEKVENLRDFSFSLYPPIEGNVKSAIVNCSYSKVVDTKDGFKRSETFYLAKGDKSMNEEFIKLLKEYFGEDVKMDFEKAEELSDKAVDAIKEALKLVNKYKGDFPDDLKKAVGTLAKYASAGYGYPEKKEKKDDIEKTGAKFSKDTLERIKKAIEALEALKALLPELKEQTQKSDVKSELDKSIEKLSKSIEELEMKAETKDDKEEPEKKEDEGKEEIAKKIDDLLKRFENIEKKVGVRKSVEGQDADVDADTKKDKLWPSISS